MEFALEASLEGKTGLSSTPEPAGVLSSTPEFAVEVTLEGEIGLLSTLELTIGISPEIAAEVTLEVAFEVGVGVEVAGGEGNSLGDWKMKTLVGDLGHGVKGEICPSIEMIAMSEMVKCSVGCRLSAVVGWGDWGGDGVIDSG